MKNKQIHIAGTKNLTKLKNETLKRTIRTIIWSKFLDLVEGKTLGSIFKFISLSILAMHLAFVFTHTEPAIIFLSDLFKLDNFLIPKSILAFLIVFNHWKIFRSIKILSNKIKKQKPEGEKDTIEGVPTVEILDHLFEEKSFKRQEVEKKFWIPRNRYQVLVEKLDDLWVLERGENNSRVLNWDFGREDVAMILRGKKCAKDLSQPIRQEKPWVFSFRPKKRGFKSPTAENDFVIRKFSK